MIVEVFEEQLLVILAGTEQLQIIASFLQKFSECDVLAKNRLQVVSISLRRFQPDLTLARNAIPMSPLSVSMISRLAL